MQISRIRNGQVTPKVVEIEVKKGWKAGTKVTYEKEGDEKPGIIPADIVFVVEETKHDRFERKGNDLLHIRSITLTEALCGTTVTVLGLDGSQIDINTEDEVVYPGYRKIIRGKGMPIGKKPGEFGHLVVEYDVKFPVRALSAAQKQKVKEAQLDRNLL